MRSCRNVKFIITHKCTNRKCSTVIRSYESCKAPKKAQAPRKNGSDAGNLPPYLEKAGRACYNRSSYIITIRTIGAKLRAALEADVPILIHTQKGAGITEEQLHTMTIENPRRAFA